MHTSEQTKEQVKDLAKESFAGCGICGAVLDDIQEILSATCAHCARLDYED